MPAWRGWEPSAYVQDNWHALPKLTLNLGLRYDVYTPFTAANNAFNNFNFSTGLLYGPGLPGAQRSNATGGVHTDYGKFAPRLGFAYEAQPGLVVRGGYGITFMSGNSLLSGGYSNAPYTFNISCGDTAAPINSIIPCPAPLGAPTSLVIRRRVAGALGELALVTDPSKYAHEGTLYTYDFNLKALICSNGA